MDAAQMAGNYEKARKALNFFDANAWFDTTSSRLFERDESFEGMARALAGFSIRKAVVTSVESLKCDPVAANDDLAARIKGFPQFYGCMILVPEIEDIEGYVGVKLTERFVCARLFPKYFKHSMKKWLVGPLLSCLEARRVPLMIWHSEVNFDLFESLASDYPKLPIIIEGSETKLLYHNRNYVPLILRYENIYVETRNVVLAGEVDYLANNAGEKLIYGSDYPYNTPDASMLAITMGDFPEKTKGLIAGGNMQHLIEEIKY